MRAALARWDGAGVPARETAVPKGVERWLPAAIVLVSMAAAAMGWQASIADEQATQKDDLSRQALLLQEQIRVTDVQEIDADLRRYGEQERYSAAAAAIADKARSAKAQERLRLLGEASGDRAVAAWLESQTSFHGAIAHSGLPYDVGAALTQAESGNAGLLSLEPARLHAEASFQRERGLHLVGLAVLFVAALVFFTCAAVAGGPPPGRGPASLRGLLAWSRKPNTATYVFTGCGVSVTTVAAILFVIVRVT